MAARAIPPPGPPEDLHRRLLRLAAELGGQAQRGDWVAVLEFDTAWHTAFVALEGVPSALVCRAADAGPYARRLHAELVEAYAARGLSLPRWRGWAALLERWPVLAMPRRRVIVLRPL